MVQCFHEQRILKWDYNTNNRKKFRGRLFWQLLQIVLFLTSANSYHATVHNPLDEVQMAQFHIPITMKFG